MCRLLPSKYHFAEFMKSLFADNPARGLESAAGETLAAARGVAQRNRIGRRVEADFVRAGVRAGAVGTHVNGPCVSRLLHLLDQLEERAGWRVFFGAVVNLPGPAAVLRFGRQQTGGFGDQEKKGVHTD